MDDTRWDDDYGTGMPDAEPSGQPETAGGEFDPEYPFEEPEQAPELRSQRSENLYSRSEPFWERVIELPAEGEEYPRDPNYWNHPEELADDRILQVESGRILDRLKGLAGSRALWIFVAVLGALVLTWVVIHNSFMQIKRIEVVGNTTVSAQRVIELSQLTPGMSTFSIDDELVIERIEREGFLRCTLVDVSFDKVVLHVRERMPACIIRHNGQTLTLDDRGWVLKVNNDLNADAGGLIEVHGLDVRRSSLGQAVSLYTPRRLTVYTQILIELKAMKGLDMILELDMTSMDSITLKTNDGFTVQLGNEGRIHEKLRAMLVVHEVVLEKGYYGSEIGGTIVVSDPTSPTFQPLSAQ